LIFSESIPYDSTRSNNVTVRNNDIGPCGSDEFQQWADGISVSCQNSIIRDNIIRGPTDGGIVIFGSPGTLVENNTIHAENVGFISDDDEMYLTMCY
jgi:parallel beta-helix repeat protein